MKGLTYSESQKWFGSIGIQIDGNMRLLSLPVRPGNIITTMPKKALKLNYFSDRLADWLPHGVSRIIWLSDWQPRPFQLVPFTKMRLGCGESRGLDEAPGHLFESSTEGEVAIIAGLLFLIMAFNWSAFFVAEKIGDYIYCGDEYIIFSSANREKMEEASRLISDYKLEIITDIKEAWK
jgi:hypothetical protein